MVWVIAEFTDKTVASASEEWILVKDGKIFCMWPLKDVERKNRANAIPDNSKNWELHECRLLMKGERFDSYDAAREAVLISQEHSTMSNYIKSKSSKRPRRRPAKFSTSESESDNAGKRKSSKGPRKRPLQFSTSESEGDNEPESKKIKSMRESDSKSITNAKKTYLYTQKTSTPLQKTLNKSVSDNSNIGAETSTENRKASPRPNNIVRKVERRCSSSEGSNNTDKTSCSSSDSDGESSSSSESDLESSQSSPRYIDSQPFSPLLSPTVVDNNENRPTDIRDLESSQSPTENVSSRYTDTQLFSPQLSATVADYDESRPTDIREELNELKKGLYAISQISNSNTVALQELKEIALSSIAVFKDLSAEVFKCKEEIKKRNGLFTDMLHPDIEVPLDEPANYDRLTEKLNDKRLIDNLAKYMATIHNENDEEEFVKASMQTLFTFNFLMKEVTWKKEADRVYVKKSRILRCWRDSFKLKFGAKEPIKSDKEVDKFIHDVCRRYKDASRKAKRTEYD